MKILYLSSSCSESKFFQLRELGITRKMPQAQKYHRLMMEGLSANRAVDELIAISSYQTNHQWSKKLFFNREEEQQGKIRYIYESFINLPILRQITRYLGVCKNIRGICGSNSGDYVIICDILNQSVADAAVRCGSKLHIPVLGIVTDVPGHTSGARRKTLPLHQRIIKMLAERTGAKKIGRYDAYLLLTEKMDHVVNPKGKPHIVIEGQCDVSMEREQNNIENKACPKVIMYAGGIHVEFGIERIVNAFIKGDFNGWELHIYGDGNYQQRLTCVAQEHQNVKYFGVKPNSEVVARQIEASVLVNPRLTDAEYVQYSFPSKTLECMASGTPLLTTCLPGMSKEYYPYVYLIRDESETGMIDALSEVLMQSKDLLHEKGARAKDFVLSSKNNIVQAGKLCEFIASQLMDGRLC